LDSYGLYVNYEWCTGCHTCEDACKQERALEPGQYGIKVVEFSYEKEGRRIIDNHPILTEHCTFCMDRVRNGDKPSCVQHCQSQCLQFGKVEELIKVLKKNGKGVLWTYPHANK